MHPQKLGATTPPFADPFLRYTNSFSLTIRRVRLWKIQENWHCPFSFLRSLLLQKPRRVKRHGRNDTRRRRKPRPSRCQFPVAKDDPNRSLARACSFHRKRGKTGKRRQLRMRRPPTPGWSGYGTAHRARTLGVMTSQVEAPISLSSRGGQERFSASSNSMQRRVRQCIPLGLSGKSSAMLQEPPSFMRIACARLRARLCAASLWLS